MKKKIVLVKNVKYNFESIKIVNDNFEMSYWDNDNEYVQLSEVIEVELQELSNKEVVKSQVAILDKQMTKVRADSEAAITALEGRKQELLAITYEAE